MRHELETKFTIFTLSFLCSSISRWSWVMNGTFHPLPINKDVKENKRSKCIWLRLCGVLLIIVLRKTIIFSFCLFDTHDLYQHISYFFLCNVMTVTAYDCYRCSQQAKDKTLCVKLPSKVVFPRPFRQSMSTCFVALVWSKLLSPQDRLSSVIVSPKGDQHMYSLI